MADAINQLQYNSDLTSNIIKGMSLSDERQQSIFDAISQYSVFIDKTSPQSSVFNLSVTASNAHTLKLNSVYTVVNGSSAYWNGSISDLLTRSVFWNSVYNNVYANSAAWLGGEDTLVVMSNSANWNSVYSSVFANSAAWTAGGDDVPVTNLVRATSANWNRSYVLGTTLAELSANDRSVYSQVNTLSANWNISTILASQSANNVSNYSTVNSNSANWDRSFAMSNVLGGLSANDTSVYSQVNTLSANWNLAFSQTNILGELSANAKSVFSQTNLLSANWSSVYSTVNTQSANNVSNYSTVNSNSANWNISYNQSNILAGLSANGQSVYSAFNAQSGNNASNYNTVNTNSGNWSSVYTTVLTNSSTWTPAASGSYVVGPVSAVDLVVPLFDGTTGKLLKQGYLTSQGNGGLGDNGKIVRYKSEGDLLCAEKITVQDSGSAVGLAGDGTSAIYGKNSIIYTTNAVQLYGLSLMARNFTAEQVIDWPDSTGTVALTSYAGIAKAWVHYDSTAPITLACTYSRTGTTVTVTSVAHGHLVGHVVQIDFTSGGALDGTYTITAVTADTYTVTTAASGTIAAGSTMNELRNTIRASYNVHSVADITTGTAHVNFSTNMIDENYVVNGSASNAAGTAAFMFPNYSGALAAPTSASCKVVTFTFAGALTDALYSRVVFFR